MTEEDLRTLVRDFRASVSEELTAQQRRMSEFRDEIRDRVTTSERAILNTVSDLGREMERRFTYLEQHARETDGQLDAINARIDRLERRLVERLDEVNARLDGVDTRFDGVDTRFDGVDKGIQDILSLLRAG